MIPEAVRLIGIGAAALTLAACAGVPNHAPRAMQPEAIPSRPAATAYTRGRRVAPEEENPPVARTAERTPLPAPAAAAADSEDPQAARERRHEEREREIKQRMNSICSGC